MVDLSEGLRLAEEEGLDLVEVAPMADLPVCKIIDYGKYKYEKSKKAAQAKKAQKVIQVKEIKFRPKVGEHDYKYKINHVRRFLEEGNRVKLTVRFKGREIVFKDQGRELLEKAVEDLKDLAKVEKEPMMEGRQMVMYVMPKGKK